MSPPWMHQYMPCAMHYHALLLFSKLSPHLSKDRRPTVREEYHSLASTTTHIHTLPCTYRPAVMLSTACG